jgi:hypothetical protein
MGYRTEVIKYTLNPIISKFLAYKTEWLAIKDEELYVGGYGKEYTDEKGNWLNDNPMWIKVNAHKIWL